MSLKTLSLTLLTTFAATPAMASDHWWSCSDANKVLTMVEGELEINGTHVDYRTLSKREINKETEYCVLKNSGQRVISYDNTVSVMKIRYVLNGRKLNSYLICEEGGSGIPAGDECRE